MGVRGAGQQLPRPSGCVRAGARRGTRPEQGDAALRQHTARVQEAQERQGGRQEVRGEKHGWREGTGDGEPGGPTGRCARTRGFKSLRAVLKEHTGPCQPPPVPCIAQRFCHPCLPLPTEAVRPHHLGHRNQGACGAQGSCSGPADVWARPCPGEPSPASPIPNFPQPSTPSAVRPLPGVGGSHTVSPGRPHPAPQPSAVLTQKSCLQLQPTQLWPWSSPPPPIWEIFKGCAPQEEGLRS